MTDDLQKKLVAMAKELHAQDNLATAHPIFMVQQLCRTYGFDPAYSDDKVVYINEDGITVTIDPNGEDPYLCPNEDCAKPLSLEAMDDEYCNHCDHSFTHGDWCLTRTAYQDTWDNVQPFFTRKGAEEYLRINGHNLKEPRIYVESAFRNAEWQAIVEMLMKLNLAEEKQANG